MWLVVKHCCCFLSKVTVPPPHPPFGLSLCLCSKVTAYGAANSCSELMQGKVHVRFSEAVVLSVGPLAQQTFHAVCISNTVQPPDASVNREREPFAQLRKMQMLPFCLWQKQMSVYNFWWKFSPSFLYFTCASNSTCINCISHIYIQVLVIVW